ncbi:MAG: 3-alpha,7-alpha,12-alpha-trihydroxy-5-beta-cholest-24-enoyl-CoA hydratase, partial [Xanthobacteraceae bacterium]|nr:3-alpha,7-alpha,12-alpha-trihydroxy-5-beta-cholest-24-enoyl-CoA hydratase [Xanthobacteraceae bacterium]
MALKIPDAEHIYGEKETMLYALGVGLGHDPTDCQQLD